MQLTTADEEFRGQVRAWLAENLAGQFADLRGLGGPGREHEHFAERLAWNPRLAAGGWTCLGWPAEDRGRAASAPRANLFPRGNIPRGAPPQARHPGGE